MRLEKLRMQARRFGAARAALGGALDAANRVIHLRIFRTIELRPEWIKPASHQPETRYECRFLERGEILHHARDPENALDEAFLEAAFEKGDECFAILEGDTLASFGWYATRPTLIGRNGLLHFADGWAYMFHGYTRAPYRGQRLHSLGLARATQALHERGLEGIVSLLEPTNWASRISSYGVGFRPCGTLVEVGFGARTRFFVDLRARARGFHVGQRVHPSREEAADTGLALRDERRFMNEYAPWYTRGRLSNSYVYQEERRRFVEWMLERLRDAGRRPAQLRFLDLGCGPGSVATLLAEHGCQDLTCLDVSEAMLREGRRALPGPGRKWVQGSIEDLPLARDSFDVAIAVFTAHHLTETAALGRALERILRPGGWCFVLDYEGSSPTFATPLGTLTRLLVAPFRFVWKRKNARALAALDSPAPGFTGVHRARSFQELRGALSDPGAWEIERTHHAYLTPHLHHTLVAGSALDAWALRAVRFVETAFRPLGPGQLQWLALRRRD